jgi:hypothetical protein
MARKLKSASGKAFLRGENDGASEVLGRCPSFPPAQDGLATPGALSRSVRRRSDRRQALGSRH